MKRISIFVLSILAFILITFTGCYHDVYHSGAYRFGIRYSFVVGDVLVSIDEAEEKFIFEYTDKDPSTSLYIDVNFTYHTLTPLRNSPEFDYTDKDGNELVFDENGYYVCNGDQILYVSYKNANAEIKDAISSGKFSISFGFGPFILNTHKAS